MLADARQNQGRRLLQGDSTQLMSLMNHRVTRFAYRDEIVQVFITESLIRLVMHVNSTQLFTATLAVSAKLREVLAASCPPGLRPDVLLVFDTLIEL